MPSLSVRAMVAVGMICLGLVVVMSTPLSKGFSVVGYLASIGSSFLQIGINFEVKRILESELMNVFELQTLASLYGSIFCLFLVFLRFMAAEEEEQIFVARLPWNQVILNSLLYYSENLLSYKVNGQPSRLTYSIIDALRRLSIVAISLHYTPFEPNILFGAAIITAGTIMYSLEVQSSPKPTLSPAGAVT